MRVSAKTNIKVQQQHTNIGRWKRKSKDDFKCQRKRKMGKTGKAQWRNKWQKPNLTLNKLAGKKNFVNQISSNKEKKDVCVIDLEKDVPMKYQENCSYSFNETSEKTDASEVKCKSQRKRKMECRDKELEVNGSPAVSEVPEKRNCFYKENTNEREGKNAVSAANSETTLSIKDQENSDYSFNKHQDRPVEIMSEGLHILSETENGESKVLYKSNFFSNDEAYSLLHKLCNSTNWNQKNNVIRGVKIPQPRLVAWYGPFPYTYSGSTLEPAEMPDCILNIKKKIETFLKEHNNINVSFNAVLLNCYRNGRDSVAWHCDDELTMGVCPAIASVSLGATRKFEMRKKFQYLDEGGKPSKYFLKLTSGSLLIMDGCMQEVWQHRIPKEHYCKFVRINLTFRTVYRLDKISSQVITKGSRQQSKYNKNDSFSKCKNNVNIYGGDNFTHSETIDSCHYNPKLNSSHQNSSLNCSGENVISCEKILDFNNLRNCDQVTDKNKNDSYISLYDIDDHKDSLKTIGLYDANSSAKNSHNSSIKKESTPFCFNTAIKEEEGQELSISSAIKKEDGQQFSISSEELVSHSPAPSEINNFASYSLQELIEYPFKTLDGVNLKYYAYSLKKSVKAEVIKNFKAEEYLEYKFLKCLLLLTDGSHTDRNQKLICTKICWLIKRHYKIIKILQKEHP